MLCFMGRSPFNALRVRKGAFSKSSFWGPAFSFHLSSCVAAAMLAGCGGSQPPIGAPGAALQSSAIGTQVDHGGSWMAPEAKSEDLLYVGNTQGGPSGTGYITVYSYPTGKLVGTLSASDPTGLCVDRHGDVFVANSLGGNIAEYAHGGTKPIETLPDNGYPNGCAIDLVTGDLAVVNWCDGPPGSCFGSGTVLIYRHARGTPKSLHDEYSDFMYYCAYNKRGDLFVNGVFHVNAIGFAELRMGQTAFEQIALRLPKNPQLPNGLQWADGELATGAADGNELYQYQLRGSKARLVHTTRLRTIPNGNGTNQFFIAGNVLIAEELSTNRHPGLIKFYKYPTGGKPTGTLTKDVNNPESTVLSLPAK
jgi:hypothetical protein